MKPNRKKVAIAASAISGVLLAGGATMAAASTGPSDAGGTGTTSTATGNEGSESGKDGDHERAEPTITGTIKAPAERPESEAKDGSAQEKAQQKAEEKAEAAALAKLATVTKHQASTAATGAVPGTVGAIALDDEDGFVVWEAEVTQKDGTVVEVLIDAGNASILAQETEEGARTTTGSR